MGGDMNKNEEILFESDCPKHRNKSYNRIFVYIFLIIILSFAVYKGIDNIYFKLALFVLILYTNAIQLYNLAIGLKSKLIKISTNAFLITQTNNKVIKVPFSNIYFKVYVNKNNNFEDDTRIHFYTVKNNKKEHLIEVRFDDFGPETSREFLKTICKISGREEKNFIRMNHEVEATPYRAFTFLNDPTSK